MDDQRDRYPNGRKRYPQSQNTEKARLRRQRLIDAGLCRQCGLVPPLPGIQLCEPCRQKIRTWQRENFERHERTKREWNARTKRKVLDHYGGVCQCCGEGRIEFLALDHVNGGGNAHRKLHPGSLWAWLWKERLPDGYQVLCHNCNMAKGFYGVCPHQRR